MAFSDDLRQLVDFEGKRTDFAKTYSSSAGVKLYIYDSHSRTAVAFKAFLSDFSNNVQFKEETIKDPGGDVIKTSGVGITYKVSLKIPAVSVNNAQYNATRLEVLDTMINKTTTTGTQSVPTTEMKYVLLSNLIHNGKYTSKLSIKEHKHIIFYGMPCYLDNLSFSADVDMGFFEHDTLLWPKVWSLSLDFLALPKNAEGRFIQSYDDNGNLGSEEIAHGKWPFGV